MKKLTIMLIIIIISLTANATTYHISTTGSNTTGNGSVSSPWKTLAHACSQVVTSGDVIHLNAGTFIETVQSLLAPGVSIVGEGNTSIILSHVYSGATIYLNSTNEGTYGNQSISYIRMDGDALSGEIAIRVYRRSNVEIHHCEFEDFKNYGVYFRGATAFPVIYATGNKFYDNIMINCASASSSISQGNLMIGGQEGMLVYNSSIIQEDRGLNLNGFAIKYTGDGYNKGLKIYNNIISVPPRGTAIWDFAIELFNSRGGIEIYNNTIQGTVDFAGNTGIGLNDDGGYGFAAKVYNNIIRQSSLRTNEESGIDIERSCTGGFYIYNNYLNNLTFPIRISMIGGDTHEDLYIYYNVINVVGTSGQSNVGHAISLGHSATNCTYDNLNVWNNVCYGSNVASPIYGIKVQLRGTASNVSIRNNIIQGFITNAITVLNSPINNLSIENNIFYNNSANIVYSNSVVTNQTEQNNLITNPLFVTPGTDFKLQSSSPAINAGLNVNLLTDFINHPINNLPDIGAYEYSVNSVEGQLEGNNTIRVYPNPVSDELSIEIADNNYFVGFELLNSIGRVVYIGNLKGKTTIQTSGFSPGLYSLKIKNGNSFLFRKIIIL